MNSWDQDSPVKGIDKRPDATVITLAGEIDLYRSPEVRKAIMEATVDKVSPVVIDATEVPYMDSSGVATMVEALQKVKRYKGRLVLVGLQDRVRSVFEIAKLTELFEIKPTLEETLGDG